MKSVEIVSRTAAALIVTKMLLGADGYPQPDRTVTPPNPVIKPEPALQVKPAQQPRVSKGVLMAADVVMKPIDVTILSTEAEFAQSTWSQIQTDYAYDYDAFAYLYPSTDETINPEDRAKDYALSICENMINSNNQIFQIAGQSMRDWITNDVIHIEHEKDNDKFLADPRIAVGAVFHEDKVELNAKIMIEDLLAEQDSLTQAYSFVYFAAYFSQAQTRFAYEAEKNSEHLKREILIYNGWNPAYDFQNTNKWSIKAREAQRQAYREYNPIPFREALNK